MNLEDILATLHNAMPRMEVDGIQYRANDNLFIGSMVSVREDYGCLDYEDHDENCPGTSDAWTFSKSMEYDIDHWVETGSWSLVEEMEHEFF